MCTTLLPLCPGRCYALSPCAGGSPAPIRHTPSAATHYPDAGEPHGAGCRARIPPAEKYALRRAVAFPAGDRCRSKGFQSAARPAAWWSAGCPAGRIHVHAFQHGSLR